MPRHLSPDIVASTEGDPDAVKNHILDSALAVIAREGLTAATTRTIAEEAGIAVGTLYNYFDDRQGLIVGSMLRKAHLASQPLVEFASRAGRGTVDENLHFAARSIAAVLDELIPLFSAVFADPDLLEALRRVHPMAEAHGGPLASGPLEAYLREEQRLGRVQAAADCRAAASLVMSLCHEGAFMGFFRGHGVGRKPIKDEIDFIADAVVQQPDRRGGGQ